MSKKSDARTALIEKRILDEQQWTYDRRVIDGLPWHAIRGLALRSWEHGGIDRNVPISGLKAMCDAHRAAQGDVVGTREERVERRQIEYDLVAQLARASLGKAAELEALDVHAAKVLLDVRAAEAKMHGDDKPAEIRAEIVTRDAILEELNAELIALGEETVTS